VARSVLWPEQMRSSWLPRLSLLVPAVCLTLQASAALGNTCKGDAATRWVPQRSWPAACEPDAVVDGLVMLDGDALSAESELGEGELQVVVQRMVGGAPVETFPGKLAQPDATSLLFQSERPLAPQSDYQITAQRVSLDGSPLGDKFTSAFTTGVRSLQPLSIAAQPTLSYEEADTERFECTVDACGEKHCEPSDEIVHVKSLRIAVPAIQGGVDLRPYNVSAKLVASFSNGQAPAVATSDMAATQAGKRSFIVLELPPLPSGAQGCVTISATDAAGHTLTTEPVCTALVADEQPYDKTSDIQLVDDDGLSQTTDALTGDSAKVVAAPTDSTSSMEASAQGCAVGRARGGMSSLGWLALALTLARLRSRKRAG
jgi:hypothetical protein